VGLHGRCNGNKSG